MQACGGVAVNQVSEMDIKMVVEGIHSAEQDRKL